MLAMRYAVRKYTPLGWLTKKHPIYLSKKVYLKKEYDLAVRHGPWVAIRDEKYLLFVSLIHTLPAMHKCRKEKCRAWYWWTRKAMEILKRIYGCVTSDSNSAILIYAKQTQTPQKF